VCRIATARRHSCARARRSFPFVERIIGDAGYQGPLVKTFIRGDALYKAYLLRRHREKSTSKRLLATTLCFGVQF
jgi:hypothetical protein